jgi:hypothetical protein
VTARTLFLIVAAFVLGAVAAGSIGVRVIREVRTAEDATSLPTTSTTVEPPPQVTYQIDPHETLIASTALVPTALEITATEVAIGYDLTTLAPYGDLEPIEFFSGFGQTTVVEFADIDHVYPRTWVLETTKGTFPGGPANPSVRVARFAVDEEITAEDVLGARITEARAPFPLRVPFNLSEAEPRATITPGVTVELLNVSDQGSSFIVQVAILTEDPDVESFFVRGDGPGWRSAFFEAEGRPRVNLTWVGGDLPTDIPLLADGTVLRSLDGDHVVSLDGLR